MESNSLSELLVELKVQGNNDTKRIVRVRKKVTNYDKFLDLFARKTGADQRAFLFRTDATTQ